MIYSYPATGQQVGRHNDGLAPRVQMPYTSFDAAGIPHSTAGYRTIGEIEQMLAMLRAKNVPAVQFFTIQNSATHEHNDTNAGGVIAWCLGRLSPRPADALASCEREGVTGHRGVNSRPI